MKNRYILTRSEALDFWISLAMQFCEQKDIELDEEEWSKDFANFQ